MIDGFATIATAPDPDRLWFADRGQRHHRLRREGVEAVASHRDGQQIRVAWPIDEPLPSHEGFARQIFEIATRAASPAA